MNKQIKDILNDATISIKWKNYNTWTKQDISNLYEACEHYHITFKTTKALNQQGNKEIIITLNYNITIEMRSNMFCLERDVYTVIKMYLCYLGGKTKFVTRFNTYNIN